SGSDGIAIQPHQAGSPSNLMVLHNTVLHPMNDAISINDITGTVVIANNAVYAQQGNAISVNSTSMAGLTVVGNVGAGAGPNLVQGSIANDFIAAHYMGAPPIDVFPKMGSALIGAADPAYPVDDDFNGTPRAGTTDAGAYVYDANGNPGWTLADGFKDAPETGAGGGPSTSAAGATSTSGSGTGGADNQEEGNDGGCGCRFPHESHPRFAFVLWLAALALLRLNRSGRASC
ncbi:MAG TPA: hypothetical protein VFB62_15650, partial [Polyangiaceae bacterium]|nr:hypothetical protein [Polyangiaceae bacterium]